VAEENRCSQCGAELPADAPEGLCPRCLMKKSLETEPGADKGDRTNTRGAASPRRGRPAGFVPLEPAELAKDFPQLEVIELLGQGGMGAVYKARQPQLDRLVALKVLPPEVGKDPAFAERFTREARSLARMNHPHIVTVHDFGKTDSGLYYFIMEYVDGTDLRRVIQGRQLSASEALAIVPQICEALQYAHEEGIVHRDIKPENVLMDARGRVRIADFGLAKLLDRPATVYTLTDSEQKMGTPHYMAPEQVEHPHDVDHRADIYSLGVVFYEMLTGELPLGRFAPPSKKVHVDVRLDSVVLKTLEKEPERRYQHASEVKTEVETIRSQPGHVAPQAEAFADSEKARRRVLIPGIGLMVAGGINVLVVAVLLLPVAWWTVGRGDGSRMALAELAMSFAVALPGLLMFLAGWKLIRMRSYGIAVTGSVLAVLPLHVGFLIGLPMGIWALVMLARPDVQEAFGRGRPAAAGQGGGRLRAAAIAFVIVLMALVMALTALLPIILPAIARAKRIKAGRGETAVQAPANTVETIGKWDFPSGTPDLVLWGPEGPVLGEKCIAMLGMEPTEATEVNRIFQEAREEYQALEAKNKRQYRTKDSLTVWISAFPQEAEDFLGRLWGRLDAVFDEQSAVLARKHLPLGQLFGQFGFGGQEVMIEITIDKGVVRHSTSYRSERAGVPSESRSGSTALGTPGLPPELRRLWDEGPPVE
jgi:predicted Ser/Thr protein kinase